MARGVGHEAGAAGPLNRCYQNRAIETLQAIEELIELAGKMRRANERAKVLGLTEEELAFYDALDPDDPAVKTLGERTLCELARELAAAVRGSVGIDWASRENVRAGLRVTVKRLLRRYGYSPEKRDQAAEAVLEQAEALTEGQK